MAENEQRALAGGQPDTSAAPAGSTDRPRRRRKQARPGEVLQAATGLLIEKGYAAATLEEVARRAGVAKGTVFVYYATKEALFTAVAQQAVEDQLRILGDLLHPIDGALATTLPELLTRAVHSLSSGTEPAIVRLVLAESRRFPELARIWHDQVSARMIEALAAWVAGAQARGEARAGDPRLIAYSISGPLLMGMLFNGVFEPIGADVPDLQALARQHADTLLRGLLTASC